MSMLLMAFLSSVTSVATQFSSKADMTETLRAPHGFRSANKCTAGSLAMGGPGGIHCPGVLCNGGASRACPIAGPDFVPTAIIGTAAGGQLTSARPLGDALMCSDVSMIPRT
jgi:hypothetical protein